MYAHGIRTVLLIGLTALLGDGCTRPVRSLDLSDPLMYANQDGGCAAGAAGCRFNTGLLLAVWADGRVLRAESADTVGLRYVLGSTAPDRGDTVRAAVRQIVQPGAAPNREITPGSATHQVVVATPDGQTRSWRFAIPVKQRRNALIEEQLISIMQIELRQSRSIHWTELPRFDSPVIGNWQSIHAPP